MLSPLVSWILSSSSSSSSSSDKNEEEEQYSDYNDHDYIDQNDKTNGENDNNPCSEFKDAPTTSSAVNTNIPIDAIPLKVLPTTSKQGRIGKIQSQRLWSKADEIELLKGYLTYKTQKEQTSSSIMKSNDFFDVIKPNLNVSCNRNQLFQKLQRLKKKYNTILGRIQLGNSISFKSAHDHVIFNISSDIWRKESQYTVGDYLKEELEEEDRDGTERKESTTRNSKRPRVWDDENMDNDSTIKGLIEEKVKSCISPLLKDLIKNTPLGLEELLLRTDKALVGNGSENEVVIDDKWRNQRIMELEVYSKRLELVQHQIKAELKELKNAN